MGFLSNLQVYGGSWEVTGKSKLEAEEVESIEDIEVVSSQYGLNMCFMLKGGGKSYCPISRDADLEEGDKIDKHSVEVLTLQRAGDQPINRVIGKAK